MALTSTRLGRDQRGMILVIALPLAVVLVMGLWYLATVGDAVLYRERLQDAADATAFESAVLHARGMNALAMLNVLSSMLLAVVAMIRATELVAIASLALVPTSGPLLEAALATDRSVTPRIAETLAIASQIESGIAAATPVLAAIASVDDNSAFYRAQGAARGVMTVSHALLPTNLDARLSVDPQRPWLFSLRDEAVRLPRLGTRLAEPRAEASAALPSLPVQEDDTAPLCGRAIDFGLQQLSGLSEQLVRSRQLGETLRTKALRHAPAFDVPLSALLCATDAASALASLCQRSPGALSTCSSAAEQLARTIGASPRDQVRPTRAWDPAENGNALLQVWAWAERELPKTRFAADLGQLRARPVSPLSKIALAQAEYFFACGCERADWSSCGHDALWSLGWTARMRRVWWPASELAAQGAAGGRIDDELRRADALIQNGLRELGVSAPRPSASADTLAIEPLFHLLGGESPRWFH